MKTRIISGVIAALLVVIALYANFYFPIIIVVALALLAAIAAYEMLCGTKIVENRAAVAAACVYSALAQFAYAGFFSETLLACFYVGSIIAVALACHKNFGIKQIAVCLSIPILMSFAFSALAALINWHDGFGLLYFLLLFTFACVSDIFAYFVGSAIGKHKMAPVISPKKSYEGLVGGIVGSMLVVIVICLIFEAVFKRDINMWLLFAVTPVFCLIGVAGDLFASAIKRDCGIKDYGKIMPGHGGVLDRLDSVLLVAPALAIFLSYVSVI